MTDEKKITPRMQSNPTSLPDPAQICEQAARKAQSIQQPDFSSMTLEEIQQQFHDLQVKQLEAGLQNEHLRSQLEERDDRAAMFRIINENMLDMVALTDLEGKFTFTGNSHEILGYEPGFLIGKNVMDLIHPEDFPNILNEFSEFVASGHPRTVECRVKCGDGTYIWLETNGNFIQDENGIPQKIVFSSRNITKRKKAEITLREGEERFKRIIQNLPGAVFVHDLEGRFLFVNKAASTYTGYSEYELLSMNVRDIDSSDYTAEDKYQLWHAMNIGKTKTIHSNHIRKDGSSYPVEIYLSAILLDNQPVIMPVVIDITDRKRIEEEVRRFKIIADNAVYGKALADLQGNIIYINRFFANIHGYSPEEVIGKSISLFHTPEQMEVASQAVASIIEKGYFEPSQIWHIHRDGTEFPMLMSGVVISDQNDGNQYIGASAIDMTEFHKAQRDYHTLFHEMLNGFALHEIIYDETGMPLDYRFLAVNPSFERMTGITAENVVGRTVLEVFPDTELHWIKTYGKATLTGEPVFFENYYTAIKKHFEVTAFSPAPKQVACIFQDITERKLIEESLRKSEERLNLAMMVKNEGIWDWNLLSNDTVFDDRYYTMAGYAPNEFPQNFTGWGERVHPDDLPNANAALKAYLVGQSERYDSEFRFRHKDGSWIWIRGQGKIIDRDKNGTPLRMIGTHTDITKRKVGAEGCRAH
jgi:PAS domain S-box-containing protein